MPGKQLYISLIGAGDRIDTTTENKAIELGREIAKRGHILICGGLGGVMDAAANGVKQEGGVSIGILPFENRDHASSNLTYSIPTSQGHGRNFLVALSGDGVVAVGGGFGTLSEIGYSLKLGKPLVIIDTGIEGPYKVSPPALGTSSPQEAIFLIEESVL